MISDFYFLGVNWLISLVIGLILFLLSLYLGQVQYLGRALDKVMAFECGFIAFKDSSAKFNMSYYLLGILFLIFDLEMIHLLPWVINIWFARGFSFIWVFWFIFLLTIGFIYEWMAGALVLAFMGS